MIARLRFGLRLGGMIAALLLALALHGTWRLFRMPSPWPRLFLGTVGRLVGARRRVLGVPLRRDVVFVANHLSWIDILLMAGTTGTAFVAKAELARVPLIGWLCTLNRTLFVSRDDRLGVARQIAELRTALADGWAVTLFPEGTTGDDLTLLPFKPTLLAALDDAPPGIRVQPVRIDYGADSQEIAWLGTEHGGDHATRILRRRGSFTATLHFLAPFSPADHPGRKAIAAEARARIAAAGHDPVTIGA